MNDDTSGCKCDWSELNSDELEEYLERLFDVADTDCDGVLNEEEYEAMLMMSGLKFPDDVEIQAYPSSLTPHSHSLMFIQIKGTQDQVLFSAHSLIPSHVPSHCFPVDLTLTCYLLFH